MIKLIRAAALLGAVLCFSMVFVNKSHAAEKPEINVYLGGFSHHLRVRDTDYKYNEVNNAAGIEYNNWDVMFMKNSFDRDSFVLAYNYTVKDWEYASLGVRGGAVTGYKADEAYTIGGISPFIQPTLTMHYKDFGVELGYLPQVSKYVTRGVATLTFKWRIQ